MMMRDLLSLGEVPFNGIAKARAVELLEPSPAVALYYSTAWQAKAAAPASTPWRLCNLSME